jgi:hypothetical protein
VWCPVVRLLRIPSCSVSALAITTALYAQEVMMHNARQEIVEKIVEKEVIKEVRVGISEVRAGCPDCVL